MSGTLSHTPSDIVAQVLIDLGYGDDPEGTLTTSSWPIYVNFTPDKPDNLIVVSDTQGRVLQRLQGSGEYHEREGIQIMVRARDYLSGVSKSQSLKMGLDQGIYQEVVTLQSSQYCLHSFSRTGNVITVGKESPESRRMLWSINGLVTLKQLS